MECKYCQNQCIKKGIRHGVQKYQCKHCGKYQQAVYLKRRIKPWKYYKAKRLNNENCGVSSISRLLHISKTSVLRLLRELKARLRLKKPVFN
jgi:transposase-like protein